MYMYVCMYIHIYIYIYTHTHKTLGWGKAELRLSPFLRCSNSIFWRDSGGFLAKFPWISGEITLDNLDNIDNLDSLDNPR